MPSRLAKTKRGSGCVVVVLLLLLVTLIAGGYTASHFYVAYADGLVSRAELQERISHAQFAYEIQLRGLSEADPDFAMNQAREILDQLIAERFIMREAVARGVEVSEEDAAQHIRAVRDWLEGEHFGGDNERFIAALANHNLTSAAFDVYLAQSLLIYRLRSELVENITITEREARAYFDANLAEFALPAMIRLRHILVADRLEAETLLRRLATGASFHDLARQFSRDTVSAELGGDLNWRVRGEFAPEFEEAAWALTKVGERSGVVATGQGYHIIELQGIQAPRERSFTEAQPLVNDRLREDREAQLWDDYLAGLRQKHRIIVWLR